MIKHLTDIVQGKATIGSKRSSRWPAVRREHLKKFPTCAVCGGSKKLEVHHIKPFYMDSSLELEPTNLITLCESKSFGVVCHLFFGHLGNYKNVNNNIAEDAKFWSEKLKGCKTT